MTNSVQSVQVAQAHSEKEQAVKQNAPVSQDQVTISQQAREALANKNNQ